VSLDPAVWLVSEETEEVLHRLPPFSSLPSEGWEIVLRMDGGPAITYKVEKMRLVAQIVEMSNPYSPSLDGFNTHVEIVVSEVP